MPTNPNAAGETLETPLDGDQDGDPNVNDDGQDPANETDPTGDAQPDAELQAQLDKAQAELDKVKKESTEWRDRFTGMQGKYQQEKKKWEDAAGDMANLPTQLSDLQTQMDSMQEKYSDVETQLLAVQTEKEVAEQSLERKNIIFKEFPGLISFEGDGLLPDGTGDDLRTKLAAFNDKMTKIGGDQFEALISGSSVGQPNAAEKNSKGKFDEAMKAYREGDMKSYDALYGQILNDQEGKE